MRILLVAPRSGFPTGTLSWLRIPQMTLSILEALTPRQDQVTRVEEEREPVPVDEAWDLVGITVATATAPRAYELARLFRARGAKVVLGGIHASLMFDEASGHADAVVVGEAEGLWEQVVEDARTGALRPLYRDAAPDVARIPMVDHGDCESGSRWVPSVAPVVASRGCPNGCDFCSVPEVYGRRPRRMPVDRVLAQVDRIDAQVINFLDDNLLAHRGWALELFAGLRRRRRRWIASFPLHVALDAELWNAAVGAGLKGFFAGVETLEEKSMGRLAKAVSLADTARAIRRCRDSGVMLNAAFIFGMDEHDGTIFDRTLEFILENHVPSVSAYVLTPYPGTAVYQRMSAEGRLIHRNWTYYDHLTPVFHPALMTAEELAERYLSFRKKLYGVTSIVRRLLPHVFVAPWTYAGLNLAHRQNATLLEEHYRRYFSWLAEQT